MQWGPAAVSLLALQAVAALAVVRVLLVLLGRRWLLLVPLTFYLLCPLTAPSAHWWAAGLNALPLQAGLAWVTADALRLVRTGQRRWAVSGTVGYAVTLAFSEKAVLVPLFAFAVTALVQPAGQVPGPARSARHAGRRLWTGAATVTAVWVVLYVFSIDHQVAAGGLQQPVRTGLRGILEGVVPALLGGPWRWARLAPSTPWADPPLLATAASLLVVAAAVRWSARHRPGGQAAWWLAGGYTVVTVMVAAVGRASVGAPTTTGLALRWAADVPLVVAGPVADCGYFVGPTAASMPLGQPVYDWNWTVRLNYLTDRDGVLRVAVGDGTAVRVPVRKGLRSVYVRVRGGGGDVRVSSGTAGMAICVTSGVLGLVQPR